MFVYKSVCCVWVEEKGREEEEVKEVESRRGFLRGGVVLEGSTLVVDDGHKRPTQDREQTSVSQPDGRALLLSETLSSFDKSTEGILGRRGLGS